MTGIMAEEVVRSDIAMFDDSLRNAGFHVIAGVDEAGRGATCWTSSGGSSCAA